jgi:DNA-binding NarL/FixJ family response regulator
MDPIRILLVDDQRSVRKGLLMRLALEPDIEVVGEAGDGLEALNVASSLHPDVLVMDYEMPNMDGVTATKALAEAGIDVRVVMLSIYDNVAVKKAAADAGVRAFVCKQDPSECLLAAIRSVVEDAA